METYTAMRHFADSWGLLAMTLFFLGVVFFIFRPRRQERCRSGVCHPVEGGLIHGRQAH